MSIRYKIPELLAPAGNATCLTSALKAGADSVYFGVESFNMRHKARNFTLSDLPQVMEQCREYGARGYLTLNSIIFEDELSDLNFVVEAAQKAGVDAVIGWDLAVIRALRNCGMEVHLSTQASVSNSAGIIEYYKNHGIRRFVMARECSLKQLSLIRNNLSEQLGKEADRIEIELFIHGAMCISLSGRCFLSECTTGHSGNRGQCLQPCRREYRVVDAEGDYEFRVGSRYVMSPKDLCTMPFIEKILSAGPSCLKIEGRMRNPEYVATVTQAYRTAIDTWWKAFEADQQNSSSLFGAKVFVPDGFEELRLELIERLKTVFNRGFHAGSYMGTPIAEWAKAPNSQASYRKETVGTVVNFFRKPKIAEIYIQGAGFSVGDVLLIQGSTTGNVTVEVKEIRFDDKILDVALKNQNVTVQVPEAVRRGDAVFRRYKADLSQER